MKIHEMRKTLYALVTILSLSNGVLCAQEIIKEKESETPATSPVQRTKVDGIVAVVGENVILDSDIDKSFLELTSQGNSVKDITRCQMLGKLLEDKLYAHHAIQDSIKVSDAEINAMMDEKLAVFVDQIGSMDKVLTFFKKDSEEEFRSYFFDILKMNKLTSEMQRKIIENVEITPEEVRSFYKRIPKDELPVFGEEVEVAQIVKKPKITEEEKKKVIEKLKGFKRDIMAGSSFYSKAVLYSQDPGSKSIGGYMKVSKKTPLVKEFKDIAFNLAEGEISEPFETMFGFHIVLVEKIKGSEIELRHILLFPKVSDESLKEARDELSQIRQKIVDKEITFAEAARSSSDEKETKANGGALINPKTMDTHFELTKMDPSLYGQVSGLAAGEISNVIADEDHSGKRIYKILTVTNKIDAHPADYAKDYFKIKEIALKEKKLKVIAKWTEEKIKETYIKINGEYRNCEFANNWMKK